MTTNTPGFDPRQLDLGSANAPEIEPKLSLGRSMHSLQAAVRSVRELDFADSCIELAQPCGQGMLCISTVKNPKKGEFQTYSASISFVDKSGERSEVCPPIELHEDEYRKGPKLRVTTSADQSTVLVDGSWVSQGGMTLLLDVRGEKPQELARIHRDRVEPISYAEEEDNFDLSPLMAIKGGVLGCERVLELFDDYDGRMLILVDANALQEAAKKGQTLRSKVLDTFGFREQRLPQDIGLEIGECIPLAAFVSDESAAAVLLGRDEKGRRGLSVEDIDKLAEAMHSSDPNAAAACAPLYSAYLSDFEDPLPPLFSRDGKRVFLPLEERSSQSHVSSRSWVLTQQEDGTFAVTASPYPQAPYRMRSYDFSPDGRFLAVAVNHGGLAAANVGASEELAGVIIYDLEAAGEMTAVACQFSWNTGIQSVRFKSDGALVVADDLGKVTEVGLAAA